MREVPRTIPRPDYADHEEGFPASERAVRGSTNIIVLPEEDREALRVACQVRKYSHLWNYTFPLYLRTCMIDN